MEFLFKALISVIYVIVKILFPFKAKGKENIPEKGGIILCSNHISMLDPVFIILTSKLLQKTTINAPVVIIKESTLT